MNRALPVCLALCLSAPPAAAQDPSAEVTVYDEWSAEFEAGHKNGWRRDRLVERPGAAGGEARFTWTGERWWAVGEERIHQVTRLDADAHGRVLRYDYRVEAPWGVTTATAEPGEGGALEYEVRVRDLPPRRGRITEEVWSLAVVLQRVLRGELPAGERKLTLIDLPGKGARERRVALERHPEGGWRLKANDRVTRLDPEGRLVEGEHQEVPGGRLLPTTAEAAPDLTVRDGEEQEDPLGLGRDVMTADAFTLRRPGADWTLRHSSGSEGGPRMWGAMHPTGAALMVLAMPFSLPLDVQPRLALGERLRSGINERQELELGAAEAIEWRELPALRFAVGGEAEMVPTQGEALLVGVREGEAYLVFHIAPRDLHERCAPLLERALGSLTIERQQAGWKRVSTSADLSLEMPQDWRRVPGEDRYLSAAGASQVAVNGGEWPGVMTFAQAQEMWWAQQEENPALRDLRVERHQEVSLGGRRFSLLVGSGVFLDKGTPAGRVRMASAGRVVGDEYQEVIVVAFSLDWDVDLVQRVIESVRQSE